MSCLDSPDQPFVRFTEVLNLLKGPGSLCLTADIKLNTNVHYQSRYDSNPFGFPKQNQCVLTKL